MELIVKQKKMEYLDHITANVQENYDRTIQEKETLGKLERSFNSLKPYFRDQLKEYLANIEHNIKVQKEKDASANDEAKKEGENAELKEVNSDQIKAIVHMVDEFNNIIAKNFAVYGSYNDFSFFNQRSTEKMEEKL